MIRTLTETVQDTHAAAGLRGSREHRIRERYLVDHLRAAESEHQAAFGDLRNRSRIQPLIGTQRIPERPAVLGESRRIHHHQVVGPVAGGAEEVNRVGAETPADGFTAHGIQGDVPVEQLHRPRRRIHRIHRESPSGHRVDAEAAGVAEQVQHLPAGRIPAHQSAIVALVKEEAGLLPLLPVDDEAPAVLHDIPLLSVETLPAVEIAVHGVEPRLERHCARALVVDREQRITQQLAQSLANLHLGPEHTHRMRLEHADPVIPVNHQSGKTVTLAVHQPETVGARAAGHVQTHAAAHVDGATQAADPEIRRERVGVERQYADSDGTYLIVAGREVLPLAAVDRDHVAFGRRTLDLGYRPAEHPGVEAFQRLVTASFQYYLNHFAEDLEPSAPESADAFPIRAASCTFRGISTRR